MLRKSLFALSSILLLGATAAGCGGDDPPTDGGEKNPCDADPFLPQCVDTSNARDGLVHSYLSALKPPSTEGEGDVTCCFDYDGNGEYDNALGGIIGMVGGLAGDSFNLDEVLGDLFEDGSLTLLFEHEKYPTSTDLKGTFDMRLFLGESESSWEDRSSNKGVFTKDGAAIASMQASNSRGVITASADSLPLSLDLSGFGEGVEDLLGTSTLKLDLSLVRIDLQVSEATGDAGEGLYTSSAIEKGGKPVNYLSAVLLGDKVASLANDILGAMCDYEGTILIFADVKSADEESMEGFLDVPTIKFDSSFDADKFMEGGSTCETIGGFLNDETIGLIGGFFDVDSNDNGVGDGISVGFNLELSGATVQE